MPQAIPICESLEVSSGVYSNTSEQHKEIRPTSVARNSLHYARFKDYLAQHSPFNFKCDNKDRLLCISTGIVAPAEANADQAFELGELAADQITGTNSADATLKRKAKVVSIDNAAMSAKSHDQSRRNSPKNV